MIVCLNPVAAHQRHGANKKPWVIPMAFISGFVMGRSFPAHDLDKRLSPGRLYQSATTSKDSCRFFPPSSSPLHFSLEIFFSPIMCAPKSQEKT